MNNKIHIPEPCHEKWALMKSVGKNQRHCDVCKTNVHDFSKKPLAEINEKIENANGEKLCGLYHERHTSDSKGIYSFVNILEESLMRVKFRRVSILLVAAILFLSGCAKRRLTGAYTKYEKPKENKELRIREN